MNEVQFPDKICSGGLKNKKIQAIFKNLNLKSYFRLNEQKVM
jgi:hypothetical protein